MKLRLLSVILLILAGWIDASRHPAMALAAQPQKISLRPFLQQLQINPGQTSQQFQLTVSNDSNFKQIFHLSTVNFGSLGETGGLVFEGANSKQLSGQYGLARWISLDKNDIELSAGQQTAVNVTINNDHDLTPGAHYAAVIVTASKSVEPVGQLTITPKVSSLVFITKLGGEKYDIHLESASNNGSLWQPASLVTLRLKSTGNTFVIPRGVVSLKQGAKIIARGAVNQESSIVLPGSIRSFDVPLATLAKLKSGWLFTKYKIQVDYRYDGNPNFATHSYEERYVNKAHAAGIAILVGVALGIVVYYRTKLVRAKSFKKHNKNII